MKGTPDKIRVVEAMNEVCGEGVEEAPAEYVVELCHDAWFRHLEKRYIEGKGQPLVVLSRQETGFQDAISTWALMEGEVRKGVIFDCGEKKDVYILFRD